MRCVTTEAEKTGFIRCPYCGNRLPGRYPDGAAGIYLVCSSKRCPSAKQEMKLNILRPAALRPAPVD